MNVARAIDTIQSSADVRIPLERMVSFGNDLNVLTEIYKDNCNMTVWQRKLCKSLVQSIKKDIIEHNFLDSVLLVGANNIENDISHIARNKNYGEALRQHIHEVIDMFCVLFDLKKAGLRLGVQKKAMCPRFHIDRVPCRLITTFCGKGTQWLAHDKVNRVKLGAGSAGLPDEISGLYNKQSDIQQLSTGDVALLKGELWEGNEGGALVHRSPPLEAEERRLVMTLDIIN
uniref:DUF1826 domain-containing protein n=1 Tax=Ningiella ruwaisensis TaxID=2364274 RepID=UPI001F4F4DD5|nr:DUF1826 domain-containing protein [Ningiella ruwaisensis]